MHVHITKHKAKLGECNYFLDMFSLLSLGHWRTGQGPLSFMSYLAPLQGHLNFGISLVGIIFQLLFFTVDCPNLSISFLSFFFLFFFSLYDEGRGLQWTHFCFQ